MLDLFSSERPSCVFARNDEEIEIVFYKTEQSHVHLTEFEVELFSFFLKYVLFSWILPQPLFLTNPLFPLNCTFLWFWLRYQMMQKTNCTVLSLLSLLQPSGSSGRQQSFLLIQQPSTWVPEVFGFRSKRVTGIRCQEMLPHETVQDAACGDIW